jgi:hypothetical protein
VTAGEVHLPIDDETRGGRERAAIVLAWKGVSAALLLHRGKASAFWSPV